MPDKKSPRGQQLIELPQFNKGTAFSRQERIEMGLLGLLPYREESLERQVERAYRAYEAKPNDLEKHIYLRQIQDLNETLFYSLVIRYASQMIPIIYTPTVGDACRLFSEIYRKPRGLFISYPERAHLDAVLANVSNESVEIIVITDSEAILGIGDQGVGGMGIPIGKLSLYAALGGIDPNICLPILLDVGTENEELLGDPLYVGWQHRRIRGIEYDDFVEQVLMSVHRKWPNAVVQFEDFGPLNATRLLDKFNDRLCCFNDDIQGTAAVTVGSLVAACSAAGKKLADCKIVIVGAGSAGCGIARGCTQAMAADGGSPEKAARSIYLIDRHGLIREDTPAIQTYQQPFVRRAGDFSNWSGGLELIDVIRNVAPDILIGVSGQPGLFTRDVVQSMDSRTTRPIVFPLSNPTVRAEATPANILNWTEGRALVATGSPFPPVECGGIRYEIAQCNNAYAFPGIGLGLTAVHARRVTDEMMNAVARVIGNSGADAAAIGASLLPDLDGIRSLSREIAVAVARIAVDSGLGAVPDGQTIEGLVDAKAWTPGY